MNDKYERTETYHERYEHDIREFRKRIDQLEEENEKLQALIDSAMKPVSADIERAIETLELLDIEALKWATTFRASPFEQDSADLMKRRSDDITLAIQALKQYQMPTSDEILWQEIFSLREKLKIAVEAIKSYDPEFDDRLFLHQLNSADYDQLMEELSGDSQYQEPMPCAAIVHKGSSLLCSNCGATLNTYRKIGE